MDYLPLICFACYDSLELSGSVAVLPEGEMHGGEFICRSCSTVREQIDHEASERAAGKIGKELRQSKRDEWGDDE